MFDAKTLAALPRPPAAGSPRSAPTPPEPAPAIPLHLQRDPREDDSERAQHERRLAAARARLSS